MIQFRSNNTHIRALLVAIFITFQPMAMAERVVSVHDGDTFTVEDGRKIRLFGMDAPELDQPFGREAQQYLEKLILGRNVSLYCFQKSYHRDVCLASINGRSLQREMIGKGLAFDNPHYSRGYFSVSQRWAKNNRRGVWTLPNGGARPWSWRHRQATQPEPAPLPEWWTRVLAGKF